MSLCNTSCCSRCNCAPCRCIVPCPCPGGSICPPCPEPAGPATATIPFSASQNGVQLATDAQGNPQIVYFSGFGPLETGSNPSIFLREGEWAAGTITFRDDTSFGSAFIMPYNGILRNIYVLFSSKFGLDIEPGSTIYPFVSLAVSNSVNLFI